MSSFSNFLKQELRTNATHKHKEPVKSLTRFSDMKRSEWQEYFNNKYGYIDLRGAKK